MEKSFVRTSSSTSQFVVIKMFLQKFLDITWAYLATKQISAEIFFHVSHFDDLFLRKY